MDFTVTQIDFGKSSPKRVEVIARLSNNKTPVVYTEGVFLNKQQIVSLFKDYLSNGTTIKSVTLKADYVNDPIPKTKKKFANGGCVPCSRKMEDGGLLGEVDGMLPSSNSMSVIQPMAKGGSLVDATLSKEQLIAKGELRKKINEAHIRILRKKNKNCNEALNSMAINTYEGGGKIKYDSDDIASILTEMKYGTDWWDGENYKNEDVEAFYVNIQDYANGNWDNPYIEEDVREQVDGMKDGIAPDDIFAKGGYTKSGHSVNGKVIVDKHPQGHFLIIDEYSYQIGDDFKTEQDAYAYARKEGMTIKGDNYSKGGKTYTKKEIDSFANDVNAYVYYTFNYYSPNHFDAFGSKDSSMYNHIKSKFSGYYNRFGANAFFNQFWVELDGGNQLKLATWIKENYKDSSMDRVTSTNQEFADNINQWVMFSFNYPHSSELDFMDAWSGSIKEHLGEKFTWYYDMVGSTGVMNYFYVNLDGGNQRLLSEWVLKNYPASNYAKGGSTYSDGGSADSIGASVEVQVVDMLLENTGQHFLDSGGDKGRQWQRNQDKIFQDEPRVDYEVWNGEISDTVSAYHYLTEILDTDEYSYEVNQYLRSDVDEDGDACHWIEDCKERLQNSEEFSEIEWIGKMENTYNYENNLSQVFLSHIFKNPYTDEVYCLFQLHGGADVRGGYTNTRCFKLEGYLTGQVDVYGSVDGVQVTNSYNGYSLTTDDGEEVKATEDSEIDLDFQIYDDLPYEDGGRIPKQKMSYGGKAFKTPEAFVENLMDFSPYGALSQMFIIDAIGKYIDYTNSYTEEDIANDRGIIDAQTWVNTGKDIDGYMKSFYAHDGSYPNKRVKHNIGLIKDIMKNRGNDFFNRLYILEAINRQSKGVAEATDEQIQAFEDKGNTMVNMWGWRNTARNIQERIKEYNESKKEDGGYVGIDNSYESGDKGKYRYVLYDILDDGERVPLLDFYSDKENLHSDMAQSPVSVRESQEIVRDDNFFQVDKNITRSYFEDEPYYLKKGGKAKSDPQIVRYYFEDEPYEYSLGGSMKGGGLLYGYEKGLWFDHILEGADATEENAYDHARGIDWQDIETTEDEPAYMQYVDTVNGVGIYHNYGTDSYHFKDEVEQDDEYEGGGEIEELYYKDTFSDSDSDIIESAIENEEVYTDDLKENFMTYAYTRLENEGMGDREEEVWGYTDENYSNGRTHKENYENLVEYLQDDNYADGGGVYTWYEFEYYDKDDNNVGSQSLTFLNDKRAEIHAEKFIRLPHNSEVEHYEIVKTEETADTDLTGGDYADGGSIENRNGEEYVIGIENLNGVVKNLQSKNNKVETLIDRKDIEIKEVSPKGFITNNGLVGWKYIDDRHTEKEGVMIFYDDFEKYFYFKLTDEERKNNPYGFDAEKRADIEDSFRDTEEEGYLFNGGGATEKEYIVEVLIDDEIDLETNVFASSEDEAMDKADELIREQDSKYEDSTIDIIEVTEIKAGGGKIKYDSDDIASILTEMKYGTDWWDGENYKNEDVEAFYVNIQDYANGNWDNPYIEEDVREQVDGMKDGIAPDDIFAKGGMTERTSNQQSSQYTRNREPFNGSNLSGKIMPNKAYVVLSYGYYPLYVYKYHKWYENKEKYSVSTSKQQGQSRPTGSTIKKTTKQLEKLAGL